MKKTLAFAGAGIRACLFRRRDAPRYLVRLANLSLSGALAAILKSTTAFAHCPLCTAAVGAGVAVSRFYGVDDTIVGVWIGAFVVSTALWFGKAFKKEYLPHQTLLLQAFALIATVVPFYFAGIIGHPDYTFWGVDKLLAGIITGGIMTNAAMLASAAIKKSKGKVVFPFQTIALIMAALTISSAVFWTILRAAAA